MKKFLMSPITRYVILGLLAAAIGISVFSLNALYLAGNAVPMPFGYGASVVLSGSMEPALSVGDLLIVREQEEYEIGDIVVYQSGTTPIVHRIVALSGETVVTRGDANNVNDEPFAAVSIKGAVISVIPGVGHVLWAMKSPICIIIMLTSAVLLVEYSFRIGKNKKEAEKEKIKAEIRALMEDLQDK